MVTGPDHGRRVEHDRVGRLGRFDRQRDRQVGLAGAGRYRRLWSDSAVFWLVRSLLRLMRREPCGGWCRFRVGRVLCVHRERSPRLDPGTATVLALGIWLVIAVTFLTIVRIPHTAYLAAIGVQVALLAAGGLTEALSMRSSNSRAARSVLPALVGVQSLWTIAVLLMNGQAPGWILPAAAATGVVAVALLAVRVPAHRSIVVVALGLVAIALVPSIWTGFVMTKSDTSEGDPYAGPHPQATAVPATSNHTNDRSYGFDPPFHLYPDPGLSHAQKGLVAYIRAHPGIDGPMMATDLWGTAEPYIEIAGLSVVPFGGFSGTIATPTVDQLAGMITGGRLPFVLLHSISGGHPQRRGP